MNMQKNMNTDYSYPLNNQTRVHLAFAVRLRVFALHLQYVEGITNDL